MQPQPSGAEAASHSPANELRWLSRIRWYAVLNFLGNALGGVTAVFILSSLAMVGVGPFGIGIGPSGPTPSQIQGIVQAFGYMYTLLPFAVVLILPSLVLLWTGLRGLARGGASEFATPSKLTLVNVVGVVLLIPGMLVFYSSIVTIMQSLVPSGARAGGELGPLFAGLGLLLVGGLLEVVGMIGGVILGLWRLGGRYGQHIVKVGAILNIVPLVSVVAPILVFVGVGRARARARQTT